MFDGGKITWHFHTAMGPTTTTMPEEQFVGLPFSAGDKPEVRRYL